MARVERELEMVQAAFHPALTVGKPGRSRFGGMSKCCGQESAHAHIIREIQRQRQKVFKQFQLQSDATRAARHLRAVLARGRRPGRRQQRDPSRAQSAGIVDQDLPEHRRMGQETRNHLLQLNIEGIIRATKRTGICLQKAEK